MPIFLSMFVPMYIEHVVIIMYVQVLVGACVYVAGHVCNIRCSGKNKTPNRKKQENQQKTQKAKHKNLKTRERPPEGVVCFTGKLCRNAAHAKRSQVFFRQVAKKKNIHTEELSSVCNHQRTKIPPVTMCIIHRKKHQLWL